MRNYVKRAPLIVFIILLTGFIWLHRDLHKSFNYPPQSDQTMYMAGGLVFSTQFRFQERAPLYAAWMGLFCLLTKNDVARAFQAEKHVLFFLLGLTIALLVLQHSDLIVAILAGLWVFNCKYLVTETNGSHVMAALLFTLSLIALHHRERKWRIPLAFFFLLLSSQARSEMWIPLLATAASCAGLILYRFYRDRSALSREQYRFSVKPWAFLAAISVLLLGLFNLRAGLREPGRFPEAFAMNFAMNYVDIHGLSGDGRHSGNNWPNTWSQVFPDISPSADLIRLDRDEIRPFQAIARHPDLFKPHLLHNLRLFVTAFPASFLAVSHRSVALIILSLLLLHLIFSADMSAWFSIFKRSGESSRIFHAVFYLQVLTLVPISFIFRVVSRYYIQIIPVMICLSVCIMSQLAYNLRRRIAFFNTTR